MVDIPGIAATLGVAANMGKAVLAADKALGEAEYKLRIRILVDALEKARDDVNELERQLEHLTKTKPDLERRKNAYFIKGDPSDTAYCTRCSDVDHRLVSLTKYLTKVHLRAGTYECPQCKSVY